MTQKLCLLVCCLLALPPAHAAGVSLDAPVEVQAGGDVAVTVTGEINAREFITIVAANTPEGEYGHYKYARSNRVVLPAPLDPGPFEIRYLEADRPFATLARAPLQVMPVSATVSAPETIAAGARIPVTWTGPDNRQDFISLVPEGAEIRKWLTYQYTKKGNPVSLTAPDEPGRYEIRYQTGQEYRVLASTMITVAGNEASLQAPATVTAGQTFSVTWAGPGNPSDFVAVTPAGADVRSYHHYRYTRTGNTLKLHAPDEPGDYEVRYHTGQTYQVLAMQPIRVEAARATLSAPAEVVAGTVFRVDWSGPDNPGDYVGVSDATGTRSLASKWAFTRHGSPAAVTSPFAAGEYVLEYRTGQSGKTLASVPLTVTPAPVANGTLRVVTDGVVLSDNDAVELILDASGSMLQQQDGKRRIEIAREVLLELTGTAIPEQTGFALRVFGHRQADACRTDLEIPLAPLDEASADARIGSIQAMNLAKTPIADSLLQVPSDLQDVTGMRVVILVTDGEETCDGDPAAAVASLRASNVDVRVDVVGFAIDDDELKAQFRYWADLGGGAFHDSATADALVASLRQALQPPFEVIDADGNMIGSGRVGGEAIDLPPGDYRILTRTQPPWTGSATVRPNERSTVTLATVP